MTAYDVDLFDDNGAAPLPKLEGAIYRSPSPLPIPHVGEIITVGGDDWRVRRCVYFYANQENGDDAVKVNLYCFRLQRN